MMNGRESQPQTEAPSAPPVGFSVVVPAHNATSTLATPIASLRAQTYPHWEAVIVNDGSTDATAELARSLAEGEARVRVVTQPASGVTRHAIEGSSSHSTSS